LGFTGRPITFEELGCVPVDQLGSGPSIGDGWWGVQVVVRGCRLSSEPKWVGEMVGGREEQDSLDSLGFTFSAQIPLSLFNSLFLISSCTPIFS
jgi:hypothetical protein